MFVATWSPPPYSLYRVGLDPKDTLGSRSALFRKERDEFDRQTTKTDSRCRESHFEREGFTASRTLRASSVCRIIEVTFTTNLGSFCTRAARHRPHIQDWPYRIGPISLAAQQGPRATSGGAPPVQAIKVTYHIMCSPSWRRPLGETRVLRSIQGPFAFLRDAVSTPVPSCCRCLKVRSTVTISSKR